MLASACRASRPYGLLTIQKRRYAAEAKPEKKQDADLSLAPPHLITLVDQIATLNILEIAQFVKLLQDKLGIAGVPMMAAPVGGAAPAAAPAEKQEEKKVEKTEFQAKLMKVADGAKYKIIKELRELKPSLSLMDTKVLVEKLPSLLGDKLSKDDAEKIAKKIREAGGEVEII